MSVQVLPTVYILEKRLLWTQQTYVKIVIAASFVNTKNGKNSTEEWINKYQSISSLILHNSDHAV